MRPVIRVKGRTQQYHDEPIPNLIEIQRNSYLWFLRDGLRELFDNFSPIEDFTGNLRLSFGKYTLGEPKYSIEECRDRDATYEAPLKVQVQLFNTSTGELKESEVYLGDLPIMTDTGTFVINGAERAVVSQLARSPGVYFKDTIDYSGRILYSAQVIPSEGAWLDFDTDANGVISVKIGQTHRFPATTLLRAMSSINTVPGSEETAHQSRYRYHRAVRAAARAGEPHQRAAHRKTRLGRYRRSEHRRSAGRTWTAHRPRNGAPHRRAGVAARDHLQHESVDRDDAGERPDA